MKSRPKRLILATIPLLIAGFFSFHLIGLALFAFNPASPESAENQSVTLLVKKGDTPRDLSKVLASKKLITDSDRFLWVGKVLRNWKKVKAGEYQLSPKMTPMEIFSVITSGVSVSHSITIREGENIFEIAAAMQNLGLADKAKFLQLCRDPELMTSLGLQHPLPSSLEGYLFPDTYFLNRTMSTEDMIRQMHKRFKGEWGSAEERRAKELGMTRHQVLTLASIIEKETGAPEERPMISSVFHNRLRKKMRLQSDPTTIYGIWETYSGNIRKEDLLTFTPYNTYTVPALPIGPISNPGKLAISAALNPSETEYLFFVSQNDGRHVFTKSFADHVQAVKKFQLDRKAREGKSWRDLGKSPAPNQPQKSQLHHQ